MYTWENGIVTDDRGNIVMCRKNIAIMFTEILDLEQRERLEDEQIQFIDSLHQQFMRNGTLSKKQYHWLEYYWLDVTSDYPEPHDEW